LYISVAFSKHLTEQEEWYFSKQSIAVRSWQVLYECGPYSDSDYVWLPILLLNLTFRSSLHSMWMQSGRNKDPTFSVSASKDFASISGTTNGWLEMARY
jgi:hypothetical protein